MTPARLLEHAGVDEALAGDLAEAFEAGASLTWYWRQAITAFAARWIQIVTANKWLTLRAVLTGWLVWAAASLVTSYLRQAGAHGEWPLAVAMVHYGEWLIIGWAIGASHRPYAVPMVLSYVAFALLMSVPAVSRIVVDLLGHPSYAAPSAPMILFVIISLLAGGLLSDVCIRTVSPSRAAGHPGR